MQRGEPLDLPDSRRFCVLLARGLLVRGGITAFLAHIYLAEGRGITAFLAHIYLAEGGGVHVVKGGVRSKPIGHNRGPTMSEAASATLANVIISHFSFLIIIPPNNLFLST